MLNVPCAVCGIIKAKMSKAESRFSHSYEQQPLAWIGLDQIRRDGFRSNLLNCDYDDDVASRKIRLMREGSKSLIIMRAGGGPTIDNKEERQ